MFAGENSVDRGTKGTQIGPSISIVEHSDSSSSSAVSLSVSCSSEQLGKRDRVKRRESSRSGVSYASRSRLTPRFLARLTESLSSSHELPDHARLGCLVLREDDSTSVSNSSRRSSSRCWGLGHDSLSVDAPLVLFPISLPNDAMDESSSE